MRGTLAPLFVIVAAIGCGGDDDGAGADAGVDAGIPVFPADYASTYVEVRNCRRSADHLLDQIRVLADPAALGPYNDRDAPFPEGAVVLKVEHDPGDADCEGPIVRWTAMVKLASGSAPEAMDWRWQDLDADRNVTSENLTTCYGCHLSCGQPPDGYDGTCTVP